MLKHKRKSIKQKQTNEFPYWLLLFCSISLLKCMVSCSYTCSTLVFWHILFNLYFFFPNIMYQLPLKRKNLCQSYVWEAHVLQLFCVVPSPAVSLCVLVATLRMNQWACPSTTFLFLSYSFNICTCPCSSSNVFSVYEVKVPYT